MLSLPRLARLEIHGFKSIRFLDFEPRPLNVLIGPNGAGKTNFIDFFHMLTSIVTERLQVFVAKQGGPDCLLFGGRRRTEKIEAELRFGVNAYCFSLVLAGNRLVFESETTCSPNPPELETVTYEFSSGPESNLEVAGDDTFAPSVSSAVKRWRVYHFHDTGAVAPARQAHRRRDNLLLKPDGGNLGAFLRRLRDRYPGHYRQIVDVVQLVAPFFGGFVYREDIDLDDRIELEWFHADDPDTVLGPNQLSDGTLRFICLSTLLLQPVELQPDLILIDEPELGLHPAVLTLVAEMLQHASDSRQVIASTQSPDLLSEFEPEDVVVVNRHEGASTFTRLDEDDLRDWLEEYRLGEMWKMNIFGGRPK